MADKRINFISNKGGPRIGYSRESGVEIMEIDGCFFKKHRGHDQLLPYEDWRLPAEKRAKDLASRISIETIAGLMLYSNHQSVPGLPEDFIKSTYGGKAFEESRYEMSDLTDQQREFLERDHIRHVLAMRLNDPATAAKWSNKLQAFSEGIGYGIPVAISSDPRHGSANGGAEYKGGGGTVSRWPEGIAMAATFSPETCLEFAEIASKEYRAMGITTALSPQVDLATEPRWMRFCDTFGEHPGLSADMGRAYCDGMQTTETTDNRWGGNSVAVMSKHWPGGGSGEGGRDAHYAYGKYNVYPGNNFEEHLIPFVDGVLKLSGGTSCSAAIMPYYSVSWKQSEKGTVGNSYDRHIIKDLLREKYGYKGVICTDWVITEDHAPNIGDFGSRCWGVENLSVAERILLLLENGVDQFGGNNKARPVLDAYKLGCEKYGEAAMRSRMEESAVRLLTVMFRCGLFENPYLNPVESSASVGSKEFVEAGYKAQLKSVVLLKNSKNVLPLRERIKVYIPERHIKSYRGFIGNAVPAANFKPVSENILNQYFEQVSTPEEADAGIVFIGSPISDSYSEEDVAKGGNGYLPISLQYRPYKAEEARAESLAGGDPAENFTNRSYRNKTAFTANESDLDNVIETSEKLKEKPLILIAQLKNPAVLEEVEPFADAIVADLGIETKAVLDIITGECEPSALLPFQMPANMLEVEKQCEDLPFDMKPYTDADSNIYDFGFGLNWKGKIEDERNKKYRITKRR